MPVIGCLARASRRGYWRRSPSGAEWRNIPTFARSFSSSGPFVFTSVRQNEYTIGRDVGQCSEWRCFGIVAGGVPEILPEWLPERCRWDGPLPGLRPPLPRARERGRAVRWVARSGRWARCRNVAGWVEWACDAALGSSCRVCCMGTSLPELLPISCRNCCRYVAARWPGIVVGHRAVREHARSIAVFAAISFFERAANGGSSDAVRDGVIRRQLGGLAVFAGTLPELLPIFCRNVAG